MKWASGSFFGDALAALFCLWVMWAPLVAVHGIVAFFASRRQRQIDRMFGRRRGRGTRK